MRALLAAALLLLIPGTAEAQVTQTPVPVTYDDYFRTITRDAFQQLQVEIGTQRFRLDLSATKKGANGMTALESVKLSIAAATPAEWEADVRQQLPAKMKQLAAKVAPVQVIGVAPIPTTDGVVISDAKRGVAMAVKSSLQPGVTGRMSVTFGVLVQRVMTP